MIRLGMICLSAVTLPASLVLADGDAPPQVLRSYDNDGANLRLPDGTLEKVYMTEDHSGAVIVSSDNGATWSDREEPLKRWASKTFLDEDGQKHAYFILLRQEKPGRRIAIDRFLDVWHVKTSGADKVWGEARIIQEGWNGSIVDNSVQLPGGRIVQPSQDWVPGSTGGPPTGNGYVVMLYSDDGGETWNQSNRITSPVFEGFNGANFGACEASVVARNDGRLWALMRTQTGRLYESFSRDGAEWTEGAPSDFYASTGPPALIRMPDGRLLVFWNNCEMPPKVDGDGVYAGRDVMHGAVSEDDGQTWRGFREVMIDPRRNLSPPKKGDRGVAYPYAFLSKDGKYAEVAAGHGRGRSVIRVDPDWLLATEHRDDFSEGIEGWSVFKPFGPVERWWRDRTQGAQLIPSPDDSTAQALHLRKPDEHNADGATWNFPSGASGNLSMTMRFRQGHQGGKIALTDRFFEPTDDQAEEMAVYGFDVLPNGKIADHDYVFPEDQWVSIDLRWDEAGKNCLVLADGKEIARLPQKNAPLHGVSYLHLRSAAETADLAGFLIGSVHAKVEP